MCEWLASAHPLSVIVPVKVCFACEPGRPAAANRNAASTTYFIVIIRARGRNAALAEIAENNVDVPSRTPHAPRPRLDRLAARHHDVGGRRAGVHDPRAALARVVRQAERR